MILLLISLLVDGISLVSANRREILIPLLLFGGLTLISLILAQRNILLPGSVLTPIAGFLLVTYFIWQGGIHDEAIGGYYLVLVAAALLTGTRSLIVFGVLATVTIAAIGTHQQASLLGPPFDDTSVPVTALLLFGTTLGLYFLITRLNRLAETAHENFTALLDANRELKDFKNALEQRVEERTDELDFAIRQLQMQLDRANSLQARLRQQATHDPLTGLFNRRYLDEYLEMEIARARKDNRPLTLLMMDIDHFKAINDTHGHSVGDLVLQAISHILTGGIRPGDIVCRYGGEELLVILPGMPKNKAIERADQFRVQIAGRIVEETHRRFNTTISVGVAVFPGDGSTQDDLLRAADHALYRAKQNGRNRVEAAETVKN